MKKKYRKRMRICGKYCFEIDPMLEVSYSNFGQGEARNKIRREQKCGGKEGCAAGLQSFLLYPSPETDASNNGDREGGKWAALALSLFSFDIHAHTPV